MIDQDQKAFNHLMNGATEFQHKRMFAMCYQRGMTKNEIWKLQDKFIKKFKLWAFSDINQDQMQSVYKFIEESK